MRLKIVLIFLLSIHLQLDATACLMASQERIIPIGTQDGCLIGIEILARRYGGENNKEIWNLDMSLKRYDQDYADELIIDLTKLQEIHTADIPTIIQEQLEKALRTSHDLEGFLVFQPEQISFCNFQVSCNAVELTVNDQETRLKLVNQDHSYPIQFLAPSYTGKMATAYRENFSFYNGEDDIIGSNLRISSIRKYSNEKYELLICHLAIGQEFQPIEGEELPNKREYEYQGDWNEITDTAFHEPILHHGKGFDYFLMSSP